MAGRRARNDPWRYFAAIAVAIAYGLTLAKNAAKWTRWACASATNA